MNKEVLDINKLYGVFCNDGTFKIYYKLDIDNNITCLFEKNVPKDTVVEEELGLYSFLAIYSPNRIKKYKTFNWLNGGFIHNNNKCYKAVPLSIIMNEFFHTKTNLLYDTTANRIEKIMQKKLKDNPFISKNIWENHFISGIDKNILPKRHDKSIIFMEKNAIIEYDNISSINGMKVLSRKYPEIIKSSAQNGQIIYVDIVTNEVVIDTCDNKGLPINRLYYNSRSGAIVQTYFQPNEVVNYVCGIKIDNNHLKNLFTDSTISLGEEVRKFKKKQRIKTVE